VDVKCTLRAEGCVFPADCDDQRTSAVGSQLARGQHWFVPAYERRDWLASSYQISREAHPRTASKEIRFCRPTSESPWPQPRTRQWTMVAWDAKPARGPTCLCRLGAVSGRAPARSVP